MVIYCGRIELLVTAQLLSANTLIIHREPLCSPPNVSTKDVYEDTNQHEHADNTRANIEAAFIPSSVHECDSPIRDAKADESTQRANQHKSSADTLWIPVIFQQGYFTLGIIGLTYASMQ